MEVLAVVEVAIFIVSLVGYHCYFMYRMGRKPNQVSLALNISERNYWIRRVMSIKEPELLIIHSFRNMILGTTFLSNSSLLIAWGLLRPLLKTDDPAGVSPRILFLAAIFFVAFISFGISVRAYTQLNFILTGFGEDSGPHLPNIHKPVFAMMTHATVFYWLGLRCFYFALPIGLWSIGPFGLTIGTALLVLILLYNDMYSH